MKNILLVICVVLVVACALSFMLALFNMHAYNNLYDGSPGHYQKLHQRMILYFVIGIILAVIETVCIVIYFKM